MAIDPILARHGRILFEVDRIEALAAGARPAHVDGLAERRWAFTQETLLHCAQMSDVLAALMSDLRADAAVRARLAHARTRAFVAAFHEHVDHWRGFPSAERWSDYRAAVGWLAGAIRQLIEDEASEIIPLLPVRPSSTPIPPLQHSYAEDAWQVRRLIFDGSQRPLA